MTNRDLLHAIVPFASGDDLFAPSWAFLGMELGLTLGVSAAVDCVASVKYRDSLRRDLFAPFLACLLAFGLAILAMLQLVYGMAILEGGKLSDAVVAVRSLIFLLSYSPPPANPVQGPTLFIHLLVVIAVPSATVAFVRLRRYSAVTQAIVAGLGWCVLCAPSLSMLRAAHFLPNCSGTEVCIVATCQAVWKAKWGKLLGCMLCPGLLRGVDIIAYCPNNQPNDLSTRT